MSSISLGSGAAAENEEFAEEIPDIPLSAEEEVALLLLLEVLDG